ncbi:MAG: hypothetical protein QXE05_04805 [Nitrososphaeria archaeon]
MKKETIYKEQATLFFILIALEILKLFFIVSLIILISSLSSIAFKILTTIVISLLSTIISREEFKILSALENLSLI